MPRRRIHPLSQSASALRQTQLQLKEYMEQRTLKVLTEEPPPGAKARKESTMPIMTPALRAALQSIFDRALSDYEEYRSNMNESTFEADYPGDSYAEWIAAREAEFKLVGDFLEELKLDETHRPQHQHQPAKLAFQDELRILVSARRRPRLPLHERRYLP